MGTAGDAPVLSTVPVVVYANGSGLSNRSSWLPAVPASYGSTTCDIATTIAALCGVPVPRQSEGMFMPEVLSAFVQPGQRAWLHYYDLFMQKRALLTEAVSVLGQGRLLNDDLIAVPPPPSSSNVSASIADLNERVGRLLLVLESAKDADLSSQLAVNWTVSALLVFVVLFPLLYWVFDRRTFINVSAALPQRVSAFCFHLWYSARLCLVRTYRRVGGHSALPSSVFLSPASDALRVNRLAAGAGLALTALWLLLMVFEFLVLFRFAYRPDPDWSWQFTLFNSQYDAYVLIFVSSLLASLLICVALHVATALVVSSPRVMTPLLAYIPLEQGKSSAVNSDAAAETSAVPAVPQRVFAYFVSVWTSLWCSVLTLLFLFSQSYHCLLLPHWLPISYLTPAIWSSRFQSLTFGFMLLVPQLYAMALAAWVDFRLHQLMWRTVRDGEEEEAVDAAEARKRRWLKPSESWKRGRHEVLWELGRLKGLEPRPPALDFEPT